MGVPRSGSRFPSGTAPELPPLPGKGSARTRRGPRYPRPAPPAPGEAREGFGAAAAVKRPFRHSRQRSAAAERLPPRCPPAAPRAGSRRRALRPRLGTRNLPALGTLCGARRDRASHGAGHAGGNPAPARPLPPLLPAPLTSPGRARHGAGNSPLARPAPPTPRAAAVPAGHGELHLGGRDAGAEDVKIPHGRHLRKPTAPSRLPPPRRLLQPEHGAAQGGTEGGTEEAAPGRSLHRASPPPVWRSPGPRAATAGSGAVTSPPARAARDCAPARGARCGRDRRRPEGTQPPRPPPPRGKPRPVPRASRGIPLPAPGDRATPGPNPPPQLGRAPRPVTSQTSARGPR